MWRAHPSSTGGVIALRSATPYVSNMSDVTEPEQDASLRSRVLECVQIGPPIVDPRDETEPTWVDQQASDKVEILELAEALHRVNDAERNELIAEHVAALNELVTHHRSVSDITDHGVPGNPVCALCIADPGSHEASLALAIVWRTGELMDALALYGPLLEVPAQATAHTE